MLTGATYSVSMGQGRALLDSMGFAGAAAARAVHAGGGAVPHPPRLQARERASGTGQDNADRPTGRPRHPLPAHHTAFVRRGSNRAAAVPSLEPPGVRNHAIDFSARQSHSGSQPQSAWRAAAPTRLAHVRARVLTRWRRGAALATGSTELQRLGENIGLRAFPFGSPPPCISLQRLCRPHRRTQGCPCGIPCRAGCHAVWDTIPCGMPCRVGYHAVRDAMPWDAMPCQIPCRVGFHAARGTVLHRIYPMVHGMRLPHGIDRCVLHTMRLPGMGTYRETALTSYDSQCHALLIPFRAGRAHAHTHRSVRACARRCARVTRGRLWARPCTCRRSGCSANPTHSPQTSGRSVRSENHVAVAHASREIPP